MKNIKLNCSVFFSLFKNNNIRLFKLPYVFVLIYIFPFLNFAQNDEQIKGLYSTVHTELVFHHNTYLQFLNAQNRHIVVEGVEYSQYQERNYRFSIGWYDASNKYAVGMGIGLSNNPTFSANAIPIFFEARYFIFENENSPYFYASFGKAIPLFKDSKLYITNPNSSMGYSVNGMKGGFVSQLGIGKKIKFFKRLSAAVRLTYDIKRYSHDPNEKSYYKSDDFSKFDGIAFTFGLFIK
jgi:hypothetical protein